MELPEVTQQELFNKAEAEKSKNGRRIPTLWFQNDESIKYVFLAD
ncbi:hypothetical protein [Gracilimonas sp.]|nr:hypothetical protein [Gracilimonas sp.]